MRGALAVYWTRFPDGSFEPSVAAGLVRSALRRVHTRLRRPPHRSSELCDLPAWTQSAIPLLAKIIPHISRITETGPWPPAPCRGMARARSRQTPARPLVSGRRGAQAPALKGGA